MKQALIIIDIQNDYFENGSFPLWNSFGTLQNVIAAISMAQDCGVDIVLVQHISDASNGPSGSFDADTEGVKIHADILAAAPQAPIVIKRFADSFFKQTWKRYWRRGALTNCSCAE